MIVVTGGAGFVGSHVAEYYARRGEKVRVIDNNSRNKLLKAGDALLTNQSFIESLPNTEFVNASIVDAANLPELMEGADAVIHAAAQTAVTVSLDDPREDFLTNAVGTFNVLDAVRLAAPTAALIFCSTNKVYGENVNALPVARQGDRYALQGDWSTGIPESLSIDHCEHSPYGASKTAADLYVQEYGHLYGLKTTVLRMSCIYGPRQWGLADQGWIAWFAKAILEDLDITLYGDGYQARDLLYVSDLVAAMDAAIEHAPAGSVYNTGGGPDFQKSLVEAISELESVIGKTAKIKHDDWRPSDQKVYVSDIRKISSELNWSPLIAPSVGIKSLVDWISSDNS
jgi:CDP-paratose 2-epimerase